MYPIDYPIVACRVACRHTAVPGMYSTCVYDPFMIAATGEGIPTLTDLFHSPRQRQHFFSSIKVLFTT